MAPVQSRLVLAVSIPAAAIAIFLSIFWLRRASKGHPPSPPDIPDKSTTPSPTCTDDILVSSNRQVHSDITQSLTTGSLSEPIHTECKAILDSVHESDPKSIYVLEAEEPVFVSSVDNSLSEAFQVASSEEKVILSSNIFDLDPSKLLQQSITTVSEEENLKPQETVISKSPSEITDTCSDNPDDNKSSAADMITEETSPPLEMGFDKQSEIVKSDLSEKLANLELDTMKISDVDIKERDSANHSPSEIMLASPSMSNFSDAHSEGSSDSGKGHSDGTTSPSRTPAGGSSVSGDPTPSIYEFIIPQIIVGRLIGRHGVFLHEIMSATHTSIFIKVHPETDKLKICAIEGSQQDIEKALEMIRKKFPLRRYPKLTLERVSFVQIQQAQQLRSEDFHLQLIEGVNNDVILSSLLSPGQFFVQQPCHPSYPCLTPLTQTLTQAYSTADPPALVNPVPDAICVCPSLGGWYRAQIIGVDDDTRHCVIKFVDYGGYLRVDSTLLKQIRADFLMLPFQAVECSLANVQPIHEVGWSEEARLFVHNMTFGRVLQAQVVSYVETGIPLVNLYTSINAQVVQVNAELVSNGYAVYVPTPVDSSTQDKDQCDAPVNHQQQPMV